MIEQMFPNAGVIISFFIGLISIFASGYAVATSRTQFVKTKDCKGIREKLDTEKKEERGEDRKKSDKEITELHEKVNDIAKTVARIDERTKIMLTGKIGHDGE